MEEADKRLDKKKQHVYYKGHPIPEGDKISWIHRLTRTRVGLVAFLLFVAATSTLPTAGYATAVLVVMVSGAASHISVRRFIDYMIGWWIYAYAYALVTFFGIRVRVFGHSEKFADRSLIILNHRCHFDWLYFWVVVAQRGDVGKWMVVLKNAGKLMPVLGWAMQFRNHFFLSRRWEKDERDFLWKLNYLRAVDAPYQILMFPEGTDLSPISKEKSDTYADTNGLPQLDYTLHPKSRGFIYTLKGLRDYKIDAVYDMTVGYPDNFAPTEAKLFKHSKFPREIHYHIVRHDVASIPETDEGIDRWLRERWTEKEARLKHFYTHRKFLNDKTEVSNVAGSNGNVLSHSNSNGPVVSNGNSAMVTNHSSGEKESSHARECTSSLTFFHFSYTILFYVGHSVLFAYWCIQYWIFALYIIFSVALMTYMSTKTDGVDFYIMHHLKKAQGDFIRQIGASTTVPTPTDSS